MELKWIKERENTYKAGYRKMLKKFFRLPNGKLQDYDIKNEGKTACILALTPKNKVLLEKVYRPGPEKILLEMPGGFVEKGEDPQKAIERELLEETGYRGEIEFVGTLLDDAYSNRIRHTFVAKNCRKVKKPELEEDEIFELVKMSLKDFRKHLQKGELTDSASGYQALDYLGLL